MSVWLQLLSVAQRDFALRLTETVPGSRMYTREKAPGYSSSPLVLSPLSRSVDDTIFRLGAAESVSNSIWPLETGRVD